MPSMTVRNLPEDLHRRIRLYAAEHGLSAEAAVRRLLDEATRPAQRLGDVVAAYARARAVDFPETPRDRTPVSPADFS
jgi:antitoxin FitA